MKIVTEQDYEKALARALDLINMVPEPEADTPEGEELNVLADEIVKYEEIHYPIGKRGGMME